MRLTGIRHPNHVSVPHILDFGGDQEALLFVIDLSSEYYNDAEMS